MVYIQNLSFDLFIVGADLRNPQLQRYEAEARQYSGVSDFLYNNEVVVQDIITTSKAHEKLDIIASGNIPLNPSELFRRLMISFYIGIKHNKVFSLGYERR